ncbi:ABC transporter, ATP-binding protein [Beggiatoa sp. PS]|nr:ABC transporter, ATP-binding protein [Beggiatoa sp. PS]
MPSFSITVKNVSVHLGGQRLLEVDEFTLHSGQKYLIMGRSGTGKTLFLKLLMGRLPTSTINTTGRFIVIFDDKNPQEQNYASYRRNQAVAKRLSIVFQDAINSLHPYRSIAEQVPDSVDIQQKLENFNFENPTHFLTKYSNKCSGGECQRFSIISAGLRTERDIFLLDEPLTDIDLISHRAIGEDIRQLLADEQRTVVLVTHHIHWLAGLYFTRYQVEKQKLVPQGEGKMTNEKSLSSKDKLPLLSRDNSEELLRFSVNQTFYFPGNKAFSLSPFHEEIIITTGTRLAFIGESGSGKSSLLRIIAGLMPNQYYERDFKAKIRTGANFTSVQCLKPKIRYGILQLIFQDTTKTLITEERIDKSLKLICQLKRVNETDFIKQAQSWMKKLSLSWRELVDGKKHIKELSLGMMRRFSLLRAFLLLDIYKKEDKEKPKLLLLDEISRGLDTDTLEEVVSGLEQFCQENNTSMIVVSHDIDFIIKICHQARMIIKGEMMPKKEEFDPYLLQSKNSRTALYAKVNGESRRDYYQRFFGDI